MNYEMNEIKINDLLVVYGTGNSKDPIMMEQQHQSHPAYGESVYSRTHVLVQIFHTDLNKIDLRMAKPIDPDLRRPIFIYEFDDFEESVKFAEKNMQYFQAYYRVDFVEINGGLFRANEITYAISLHRLRFFTAWVEFLESGEVQSNYVQDCTVESAGDHMGITVPDISFGDFVSCLSGEKKLVQEYIPTDPDEDVEVDGIKIKMKNLKDYMINKASLERSSTGVMN